MGGKPDPNRPAIFNVVMGRLAGKLITPASFNFGQLNTAAFYALSGLYDAGGRTASAHQ